MVEKVSQEKSEPANYSLQTQQNSCENSALRVIQKV